MTLFTLTTLHHAPFRHRTVGIFQHLAQALEPLEQNLGDLNEAGYYPYAVVECTSPGLYPFPFKDFKPIWYLWESMNPSGWIKLARMPSCFEEPRVLAFHAIG